MVKVRQIVPCLMVIFCVSFVRLMAAQGQSSENSGAKPEGKAAKQDLKLISIGHGTLSSGHWNAFRIYAAPDGSKGQIVYTQFDSLPKAQQQIEEWVKLTTKVTSRDHDKNSGGQSISERVVAMGRVAKSSEEEFVIIRRDGLNCYLIESLSLQIAMQVEDTIGQK